MIADRGGHGLLRWIVYERSLVIFCIDIRSIQIHLSIDDEKSLASTLEQSDCKGATSTIKIPFQFTAQITVPLSPLHDPTR